MQILFIEPRREEDGATLGLLLTAGMGKVWLTKTLQVEVNQGFPWSSSTLLRKEKQALTLVIFLPAQRQQDGDCSQKTRRSCRGMAQPSSLLCSARAAHTQARCLYQPSSPQPAHTGKECWQIHRGWTQRKPWSKQLQFHQVLMSCSTLALISVRCSCPTWLHIQNKPPQDSKSSRINEKTMT